MQLKRYFILTLSAFFITSESYAADQQLPWPAAGQKSNNPQGSVKTKEVVNQAGNLAASYAAKQVQHWFDRTDITAAVQEDNKPVWGIETIQPLFMNNLHTFFWQGRLSYSNTSTTANLGLGYRYLTTDKSKLWGINAFYDENIRFLHKRVGLGGELFTSWLTFRANYYNAISGTKLIGSYNEKALDGADISLETPVPYVPWSRFVLEAYHWQGVTANNVNGGSAAFRAYPMKNMELDLGMAHDNSQGNQGFLAVNFYLGRPSFIEYSATNSKLGGIVPTRHLEDFRLQKVYRHNEIVVEKSTPGVSGSGIIIARGT